MPRTMGRGEARGAGGLPGLAAPDEVLLRAAAPSAGMGRPVRPLPRAVPGAPPHGAGRTRAHEPAGRGVVVRRLERDRARRPPGGPRPAGTPALSRRPAGQGAGPHAGRGAPARGDAPPHDGGDAAPVVPHAGRAARPGEAARAPRGRERELRRRAATAAVVLLAGGAALPAAADTGVLPRRVHRIVVHVLGNPGYETPERRWVFLTPPETRGLWRPRFGAHWIVWTDGSIWPRHAPRSGEDSFRPAGRAGPALEHRLAREAAPVYSQLHQGNSHSIGIELAHSGRADDPFPEVQVRSLAWLL